MVIFLKMVIMRKEVSRLAESSLLIEMGKRIADRRRELGMTQVQVAEQVGLSLQSISCIELGKKAVRPENLLNLCRVLGTTSDYILTGEKNEKQLMGIWRKIAKLNEDDYQLIETIIEHLNKRK